LFAQEPIDGWLQLPTLVLPGLHPLLDSSKKGVF
jgi:hypothetical protein